MGRAKASTDSQCSGEVGYYLAKDCEGFHGLLYSLISAFGTWVKL